MSDDSSLRAVAYSMCKKVVSASQRDELKRTVEELNAGAPDRTDPSAGIAGYMGRRQHAQFYGYLVVDDHRATSEHIVIPQLREDQRRILRRGHAATMHLNEACVAALRAAAPACIHAVDPYSRFQPLKNAVQAAPTLLKEADVAEVAEAFTNSRAVKTILETPSIIRERLGADQCAEMVGKLIGGIERSGAIAAPADLVNARRGLSSQSPETALARYWFAMGCARATLSALDQMMFQATLYPRILSLDEDVVFALRGPIQHGVGVGYSADCQPAKGRQRAEPGDVLLLALPSHDFPVKSLCFVTHALIQFDQQLGTRMRMDMRELDEDLNPYFRLLQ